MRFGCLVGVPLRGLGTGVRRTGVRGYRCSSYVRSGYRCSGCGCPQVVDEVVDMFGVDILDSARYTSVMPTSETLINLSDLQPELTVRDRNSTRFNDNRHADVCHICCLPLTTAAIERGWMVRTVRGYAIIPINAEWNDEASESGMFPVGSECARRIPKEYRTR